MCKLLGYKTTAEMLEYAQNTCNTLLRTHTYKQSIHIYSSIECEAIDTHSSGNLTAKVFTAYLIMMQMKCVLSVKQPWKFPPLI